MLLNTAHHESCSHITSHVNVPVYIRFTNFQLSGEHTVMETANDLKLRLAFLNFFCINISKSNVPSTIWSSSRHGDVPFWLPVGISYQSIILVILVIDVLGRPLPLLAFMFTWYSWVTSLTALPDVIFTVCPFDCPSNEFVYKYTASSVFSIVQECW